MTERMRAFLVGPDLSAAQPGEAPSNTAGYYRVVEDSILGDYQLGKEAYWLQHSRFPTVLYLGRQTRMRLYGNLSARYYLDPGNAQRDRFDGLVVYVVDAVEYMAFG